MAAKRRKKEAFSRWDAADYLKSDDDMAAYLQACLEEAPDDPALIAAALGDIARARGMVQLAKETGLTREGLYKALSKDGNPLSISIRPSWQYRFSAVQRESVYPMAAARSDFLDVLRAVSRSHCWSSSSSCAARV